MTASYCLTYSLLEDGEGEVFVTHGIHAVFTDKRGDTICEYKFADISTEKENVEKLIESLNKNKTPITHIHHEVMSCIESSALSQDAMLL